jgi:adenine phosphoribosyltransferase
LTDAISSELKRAIRSIPDYPKKGIVFRDLTTLWRDGRLLRKSTEALGAHFNKSGVQKVVGIEARGFIVGAPLSLLLGVGFAPARKSGKLPYQKVKTEYELEYGRQELEMHRDSIAKGERVLIVDDLLATGGTSAASGRLVKKLGGVVVGFGFVAELSFLHGRDKLKGHEVFSLVKYEKE